MMGPAIVPSPFPRAFLLWNLINIDRLMEANNNRQLNNKIKCCDCPATNVRETGRNLNTRLTGHRRATKNDYNKNSIAEHHLLTDHRIDWGSVECISLSTDY